MKLLRPLFIYFACLGKGHYYFSRVIFSRISTKILNSSKIRGILKFLLFAVTFEDSVDLPFIGIGSC